MDKKVLVDKLVNDDIVFIRGFQLNGTKGSTKYIFNRPGETRAALQTPLSFID